VRRGHWMRTPSRGAARCWARTTPNTLWTANNLASDLRVLGEYEAARVLDEDVLARSRRKLGEDHPETLRSAHNLALDLEALERRDQLRGHLV
jgi:Tetratricopeptide repeat